MSFEIPIWKFKIERTIKMADTEQTVLAKANDDTREISIESAESGKISPKILIYQCFRRLLIIVASQHSADWI